MGTLFEIKVYGKNQENVESVCSSAFEEAHQLEATLSAHDPDSELSRLNKAPSNTPFQAGATLLAALETALHYARLTDGAFDPTLGSCIHLWHRTLTRKKLPSPDILHRAQASCGFSLLTISPPTLIKQREGMKLDLGGIGKGMAVDAIAKKLRAEGLTRFCISSTSDVLAGDPPPGKTCWRVSLGDNTESTVPLVNEAVSTSGDKSQFTVIAGRRYSHVLNPATGLGLENSRTVTVQAKTATEADALSTAFCVLPRSSHTRILLRFPDASILRDAEHTPCPLSHEPIKPYRSH